MRRKISYSILHKTTKLLGTHIIRNSLLGTLTHNIEKTKLCKSITDFFSQQKNNLCLTTTQKIIPKATNTSTF